MNPHPAIIVIAYNRPACLKRLLTSLQRAKYPAQSVELVISVDYSGSDEVYKVAESFEWSFGNKKIISGSHHLGLKKHVLQCGDLTGQYGGIILLEDDLLVSPYFYSYATSAANFYRDDQSIAGISLFNYRVAENCFFPFSAVEDGADVYFLQVASSWGQLFSANQWKHFRLWLTDNENELPEYLPQYLRSWSASSWKKHFIHYLIQKNKYFVFPRVGLSTNFGEEGVNTDRRGLFQTPLLQGPKTFRFVHLKESAAVYDAWFEITRESLNKFCPQLSSYDYTVDLHGTKDSANISTGFLLSSKKCFGPIFSFANDRLGAEENVIENLQGDFYHLAKKEVFKHDSPFDIADYYVGINSMKDLVFKSHLDKMQAYPPLLVMILHNGDDEMLKVTLASVFKQNYPEAQLTIKIFYKGNAPTLSAFNKVKLFAFRDAVTLLNIFGKEMSNSVASYNVFLKSGEVFFDKAFTAVNGIFKNYPDIKWLTGIETPQTGKRVAYLPKGTAARRWNKHIFEKTLLNKGIRHLPPAATFWKRELWNVARQQFTLKEGEDVFDNLYLAFFTSAQLYTCEIYLSSSPSNQIEPKGSPGLLKYVYAETGLMDRLWEFFFINNIPYLRSIYKQKNELKPVVRFDHYTQCYFMCDY